jgi:hypothetical protein
MFDYITYKDVEYQTKDTPSQMLDNYKIENDELWYEEYDATWVEDSSCSFIGGYIERENTRWIFCKDFDGVINFYTSDKKGGWIEYRALFMDGRMIKFTDMTK